MKNSSDIYKKLCDSLKAKERFLDQGDVVWIPHWTAERTADAITIRLYNEIYDIKNLDKYDYFKKLVFEQIEKVVRRKIKIGLITDRDSYIGNIVKEVLNLIEKNEVKIPPLEMFK